MSKIESFTIPFDDSHAITLGGTGPGGSRRLLKEGEIIGGSYVLKSLLGRGGMGYVFRAEHTIIKHDHLYLTKNNFSQEEIERYTLHERKISFENN